MIGLTFFDDMYYSQLYFKGALQGLLMIAYSNQKYRRTYSEKQGYYHWTLSHSMEKPNTHLFVEVAIIPASIVWETIAFLN